MLKTLLIKNIVLIDKLKLEFNKGFTVFSGETGAGKSVILTSLGLATGTRADFSLIRKSASDASVIAEFIVDSEHLAYKKILSNELGDQTTIILRRTLSKEGISKAYINDTLVTVNFLQEIGSLLVEIHGQNEKIGLLDTASHIKILDKFGVNNSFIVNVKSSYDNFKKLHDIHEELSQIESNKQNHIDEIKNDIKLLENLNLENNEHIELVKKRSLMVQYEKIFLAINNIYNIFDDEGENLLTKIAKNINILENISSDSERVDEISQLILSLNNIQIEGKDVVQNILRLKDNFIFDQKELDLIEQRLFDISTLARRFKVQPEQLNNILKKLGEELKSYNQNFENIEQISIKLGLAKKKYEGCCALLSQERKKVAKILQEKINLELGPLKLEGAFFHVNIRDKEKLKWSADGADTINFLVRLNKGSNEGEIHKVSSGGELSRLMLAINLVIAQSINRKTLIFDEVDSGVSGAVSEAIGIRLLDLSNYQQVFTVTHLPQVASRGNKHFIAIKNERDGVAYTSVKELSETDRADEIAKMISGNVVTEEAIMLSNKLLKK
ncbi:DNA repair protein RecN [Alphaproteobacteria bacterium]|nr:DNA repair protein RecN [Alphaproteobacteria bacterium]